MGDTAEKFALLGRVVARSQLKYPTTLELWIGVPSSWLLGSMFALGALVFLNDPKRDAKLIFLGPLVGIALIAWSLCIIYLALETLLLRTQITVYQGGLSKVTRWRKQAWTWDEITAVRVRSVTPYPNLMVEQSDDGEKHNLRIFAGKRQIIHLNQRFKNTETMVPLIVEEVSERRFSAYESAYKRGETLEFGKLQMSLREIKIGRAAISRTDISRWEVEGNALVLHRHHSKPIRLDQSKIPNIPILVELGNQSVVTADEITGKFGARIHKYTYDRTTVWIAIGMGVMFSAMPTGFLGILIWRRDLDVGKFAIALALYGFAAHMFWKGWVTQQSVAETYERGLRVINRKGERSWYWKDFTRFVIAYENNKEKDRSKLVPVYNLYIGNQIVFSVSRSDFRDGAQLMREIAAQFRTIEDEREVS